MNNCGKEHLIRYGRIIDKKNFSFIQQIILMSYSTAIRCQIQAYKVNSSEQKPEISVDKFKVQP